MTEKERAEKLAQKVKIELTVKEVKHIENSLRGWGDTLTKNYGIDKKPLTPKKKIYSKAVKELYDLAKFFNGLY